MMHLLVDMGRWAPPRISIFSQSSSPLTSLQLHQVITYNALLGHRDSLDGDAAF